MDLGKGLGRWNTMPTRRRTVDRIDTWRVDVLAVVEHLALRPGRPGISSFMRLKQRMSVLLPQPDGPMMAVMRRGRISMLTPLSAMVLP